MLPGLDHIMRSPTSDVHVAPAIEGIYYVGIHTAVYNYLHSDVATFTTDNGEAIGADIYERLDHYYAGVAREIYLDAPQDDVILVSYLIRCFHRYSVGAGVVNRLLNCINQYFVSPLAGTGREYTEQPEPSDAGDAFSGHESGESELSEGKIREMRADVERAWYMQEESPSAEAASPLDSVVPLQSLAHRRFRTEVVEPMLAHPGGRLVHAVDESLERMGTHVLEKHRIAKELAMMLSTVGIGMSSPLAQELYDFAESVPRA